MKIRILACCLLCTQILCAQSYKKIHSKAIVVDTHNDVLMKAADQGMVMDEDRTGKNHSDLNRWKKGGLDVQIFSVYTDGNMNRSYSYANRQMDTLDAVAARNPGKLVKAANYREIMQAVTQQKIAAMFGVEGGHMIEDDLSKLDALYNRGARYLTLTHNIAPSWATSAADETSGKALPHKGLTEFGKQVVKRMNGLGMIVDISHAGDQTFWDVIAITSKPIMASHSSVYALTPHRRNLKDEQIKAIAKNAGVVQINYNPGFIDSSFDKKEAAFFNMHAAEMDSLKKAGMHEHYVGDSIYRKYAGDVEGFRPPLSNVIDHIEYIIKLVGADYVGIGSDFDGINVTPLELDDVTSYPLITKALIQRGYSKKDITKIMGGNFLRVLKANEKK